MEVTSPRHLLISNLQSSQQKENGKWQKLINKTSNDGFVHGSPRPHSPFKTQTYTKGSWEDFVKRSDMIMEKKGIRILPHQKDHFQVGYGTIALIDEKDMFNLRGQKRIKLEQKESHVFDAYRKKFSTNIMSEKDKLMWIERFRSDYAKYHHSDHPSVQKSIAQTEYSKDLLKQKIVPKQENSYLAISEAKKEMKEQKLKQSQLRSEQKQRAQNQWPFQPERSPPRQQISYEQYKSLNSAMSPIDQRKQSEQNLNQRSSIKDNLSPNRENLNPNKQYQSPGREKLPPQDIVINTQESDCDWKKKTRKALPTSEQHKQFMEYKKQYDSIKFG